MGEGIPLILANNPIQIILMQFHLLDDRPELANHRAGSRAVITMQSLLHDLSTRELSESLVEDINQDITQLNQQEGSPRALFNAYAKVKNRWFQRLLKEHKLVTKGYYRNLWMSLGMVAFGLPLGSALGASLGNMAFLGTGLPIGMVIGMAFGAGQDKKAEKEGRVLNLTHSS